MLNIFTSWYYSVIIIHIYALCFQKKSDWRLEELFVVEQHQAALEFDQTPQHPMTVSVKTSSDIQQIFDLITYSKSAAILRMIRYIVSDFYFHEPLKLFLEKYKYFFVTLSVLYIDFNIILYNIWCYFFRYGIVSPDMLWSSYENYYFDNKFKLKDNVSFTNFVLTWTDQSGYPIVNVTKNNNVYTITQVIKSLYWNI